MPSEERIFTPSEAAVVSGVPLRTVHREIDDGPLRSKRKKPGGKRFLREEDLFYLAVAKGLDTRLVQLTSEGKDKLHAAIIAERRKRAPARREFPLFGGRLSLDLKRVLEEVRSRVERLERARRLVVEDEDIRGGEPCIRGTRIGVYEVASMLEQGASEEELLEGYPLLRREQLELARIFAQAYPRKGRPPLHPWHDRPWRESLQSATRG
jgi:uncharacterized protein (DUF433 family)